KAIAFREKMLKQRKEEDVQNGGSPSGTGGDVEEGQRFEPLARRRLSTVRDSPDFRSRSLSINPLAPSTAFDETLKNKLNDVHQRRQGDDGTIAEENGVNGEVGQSRNLENGASGDDRIMVRDWSAPTGKRISVPVRIEPKVYFAVERTFLVSDFTFIFTSHLS